MKRMLALLMMVLVACSAVVYTSAAVVHGDADLDGEVSVIDATEIQFYVASLVGMSNDAKKNSDVDSDGDVSVMDATCIQFYLAGLVDKFPSADTSADLSLYRPYIKKALDTHDGMGFYDPQGVLCDVDNNGVEELVMLYIDPKATVPSGNFHYYGDVYSIYTIEDNKVVPLVENKLLFMHAGGPSGNVYLVRDGEESFLAFCYREANPGMTREWYLFGDWDFYYIDGAKLTKHRNIDYFYVDVDGKIDYSESYITENGTKSSYKDFENWFDSCDKDLLFSSYSENSPNNLEYLYNELA